MATFISLNHYDLVEVAGVDAEKYLQGQLTCDVVHLPVGASTLTAHCDPKGKMNSLFRLIKLSAEQFLILMPKALLTPLDHLKKYAVFSKVTFQVLDWQVVGLIGEKCGRIHAQIELDIDENRAILINPTPLDVTLNGDEKQWLCADIQAGLPSLSAEIQNEFIPQALNLQAIEQAISFTKGCYIGQETVARAKYRGANKRAMYVLSGETTVTPKIGSEIEMQLETTWRKTGTIVSTVNFDGVLWLQVVMNNDLEEGIHFRLPEDGTVLKIEPLPYSINS